LARAPENLTKPDKVALKPEPKTGTKRYIVEIDGEPWFVGSAWRALGYPNTSDAITRHCKGVVKYHPLRTIGVSLRACGEGADPCRPCPGAP